MHNWGRIIIYPVFFGIMAQKRTLRLTQGRARPGSSKPEAAFPLFSRKLKEGRSTTWVGEGLLTA